MRIRMEERAEQTWLIICGLKIQAVNTVRNVCGEHGEGYIASLWRRVNLQIPFCAQGLFSWLSLLVHLMLALYTLHLLFSLQSCLPKHLSPQRLKCSWCLSLLFHFYSILPQLPANLSPEQGKSRSHPPALYSPRSPLLCTTTSQHNWAETFEEETFFHGEETRIHCNEKILLKFTQLQVKFLIRNQRQGSSNSIERGRGSLKKIQIEIHYWNKAEQELFSLAQTWNIME